MLPYFKISKDEWDSKENTGKPIKNAVYMLQYTKRHLWGQNNAKQRKNYACLSKYISKSSIFICKYKYFRVVSKLNLA